MRKDKNYITKIILVYACVKQEVSIQVVSTCGSDRNSPIQKPLIL